MVRPDRHESRVENHTNSRITYTHHYNIIILRVHRIFYFISYYYYFIVCAYYVKTMRSANEHNITRRWRDAKIVMMVKINVVRPTYCIGRIKNMTCVHYRVGRLLFALFCAVVWGYYSTRGTYYYNTPTPQIFATDRPQ